MDAPPPQPSGYMDLLRAVSGSEQGMEAASRNDVTPTDAALGGLKAVPTPRGIGYCEQQDWIEEGMDPNSSYLLKIKLFGNRKKIRKDMRCYLIEKVVDSDMINFKDLVESITEQYPPGYLEVPHVQYYDECLKTFPEVSSDQELMLMFEKNCKSKVVDMFISYCHPSEPFEPVTEWDFGVQGQPDNTTEHEDEDEDEDEDYGYLRNPLPNNEYVGIDEEDMYLDDADLNCMHMVAWSDKGKEKTYVPEHDDDSQYEGDTNSEDDEMVDDKGNHNGNVEYDKDDPPMIVGSAYPNMDAFKVALSQHAVKHEFDFETVKSAPYRFTATCSRKNEDKCPWRIHASALGDQRTVVVRTNPAPHCCSSTRRKKKMKNATKHWVCDKVKDFLIADATLGPIELQKKLKEHYKVSIPYKRVYMGKELAMRQLYGDWDSSFNNLFRFKAEIERCCPGSMVVIDHHTIGGKVRFKRLFFALRPCIEGFLSGCRPYLAIDSTFLTGKFKGQLASASAVDGHNWLYPVCFGIFDSETNDNWIWFMLQLRQAVG